MMFKKVVLKVIVVVAPFALFSCSQAPAKYVDNSYKVYHKSGEVSTSTPTSHSSYNIPTRNSDGVRHAQDEEIWEEDENGEYKEVSSYSQQDENFGPGPSNNNFHVNSSNFALAAPMGNANFIWPIEGRVLKHYNKAAGVEGVNIGAPLNTPVRAASNGRTIYVGDDLSEYGKLVIVKHENDLLSAYAHLDSFMVNKGDAIERGQILGTIGQTGEVSSPQLHFSIRKNDNTINPEIVATFER